MPDDEIKHSDEPILRALCAQSVDGYVVHVQPSWVPRNLRPCLDKDWEGHAQLDFEQLARQMQRAGLSYGLHRTASGSVELEARGEAAAVMGSWLASMFASGVR